MNIKKIIFLFIVINVYLQEKFFELYNLLYHISSFNINNKLI